MIEVKKPMQVVVYRDFTHPYYNDNSINTPDNYHNPFYFIQQMCYKDGTKPNRIFLDETFLPSVLNPYILIGNHGTCYDSINNYLLKPYYNGGYVHYYFDKKLISAHRLIMLTFEPNINSDHLEVNHKDGIKDHNFWHPDVRFTNLEWVTRQQNIQHAYNYGLNPITYGETKYNSKYTNEEVKTICELLQQGYSSTEIGKIIGRSGYNYLRFISNLRKNKAWQWLTKDYDLKPAIRHSEEEIILICELLMLGLSNEEVSQKLKEDFDIDVLPGFIKTIRYNNENWTHITQNYNFPSRLHRPYDENTIHKFCELLEMDYDYNQIAEIMGYECTGKLKQFLYNLKTKQIYPHIVFNYNFHHKKQNDKLSDREIELICEGLEKKLTAKEIAEQILHTEFTNSLKSIISQIKRRKYHTHISSKYNF